MPSTQRQHAALRDLRRQYIGMATQPRDMLVCVSLMARQPATCMVIQRTWIALQIQILNIFMAVSHQAAQGATVLQKACQAKLELDNKECLHIVVRQGDIASSKQQKACHKWMQVAYSSRG